MNTLLYDRLANASHSRDGKEVTAKRSATGDNYQSLKLFTRLLWKEYRQLRPIWITLALIIVIISSLPGLDLVVRDPSIAFNLIFSVPALFALMAGICFFANENEQGTDRWLVQWTVPATMLFIVKYVAAFCGIVLLVSVSIGLASVYELPIEGRGGSVTWTFWHGAICFVAACVSSITAYVLAAAASIVTGRVIATVIIAGITFFAMVRVYFQALSWHFNRQFVGEEALWTIRIEAGLLFALFCVALVIAPFLLARRLRGASTSSSPIPFERTSRPATSSFRTWRARGQTISLLWKEYRQSWIWILGLVAFTIFAAHEFVSNSSKMSESSFGPVPSNMHMFDTFYESRPIEMLFVFIGSIFMGVAYLAGLFTFMSEQRGRSFRFLTHQGVSAPYLWSLKQAVWLPFVCVWIALLLIVSFNRTISISYVWAPWGMLTAYAVLQLAILLIPQTILAVAIGLCGTVILLYFSLAMTLLDLPFLFMVAIPMPIFLLLSSLALSRSWMEEASGWRSAWKKFGVVVGPLAVMIVVACLFRAFEIPATPVKDLIPAHLSLATPEELATANAYAVLFKKAASVNEDELKRYSAPWPPLDYDSERHVVYSDDLIAELIGVTKRPVGAFSLLTPDQEHQWIELRKEKIEFELFASMLFDAAEELEKKGEWNKAKEMYLAIFRMIDHAFHRGHDVLRDELYQSIKNAWRGIFRWAKQPNTTVKQISDVIDQLKSKTVISPFLLKEWYLADQDMYSSEYPHNFSTGLIDSAYFLSPWERVRARRLKSYQHAYHLKELDSFINSPARTMEQPSQAHFWRVDEYPWYRWERNTPTDYRYVDYGWYPEEAARKNLAALSAIAWKKKYGDLPDELSAACKEFLGERPVDSWNGKPFQIVRLGNRFQIVEANDHEWERELKAKYADPRIEEGGFSWHPGEGYSTDSSEKKPSQKNDRRPASLPNK